MPAYACEGANLLHTHETKAKVAHRETFADSHSAALADLAPSDVTEASLGRRRPSLEANHVELADSEADVEDFFIELAAIRLDGEAPIASFEVPRQTFEVRGVE